MTTTYDRLYGPANLGTSPATLLTVPPNTTMVIDRIRISNPDSVARTFTLSIGADATGTRLYSGRSVPPNGEGLDIWGPFTLEESEVVQASASNAILVITISGRSITSA